MKNLKIKNIAVASALVAANLFAAVANAQATYSVTDTSTNTTYNLTLLTGAYNTPSVASTLQAQPWWGNSSLALTIATLSAGLWNAQGGLGGNGYFPLVPYAYVPANGGMPAMVSIAYWNYSSNIQNVPPGAIVAGQGFVYDCPSGCPSASSAWDWVIATGYTAISSVAPNAYALRSVYNIQSAALNAGLSYDCNVFDKEGFCLSTGGRYSTTNSPSASSTSGLLIGSYKYDKNIRLGAWIDQNLSTNNADGVKLGNSKPLLGVFGVWSERDDGLGYEVKVSAGYGEKDLTVTRSTSNEGSAKVNTKGIQSVSSYGIALDADWIAAPYAGLKYVSISRGGYTEGGSSALTYDTLRQETTSVLAGVKFTGKIDPQTFAVLSAGVEHDLNHNVGQYSAVNSSFSVTTTVFNQKPHRTRPVVSAGVYYDLDKTQRLGLNAVVRQEAFQSTSSTSAMATYTVGF